MKQLFSILLLSVTVIFFFSSCEEEIEEAVDLSASLGYDYLPLEIGRYVEYKLDSTIYLQIGSDLDETVTTTTYVKEVVLDVLSVNGDETTYRFERYEKSLPEDSYVLSDIWTYVDTKESLDRVENNLKLKNLTFPISTKQVWDPAVYLNTGDKLKYSNRYGEVMQTFKDWNAVYTDLHKPMTINSMSFDSTITVVHADATNLIERRYAKEVYAKGVGLIKKEMIILDDQCDQQPINCQFIPWENKADRGFMLTMEVVGHN